MSSQYISNKKILPTGPLGADVLIIPDFPDSWSESENRPLAGEAYTFLERAYPGMLSSARIHPLSMYKPANNDPDYLEGSDELRESIAFLKSYISTHPPKYILTLGELPLRHLLSQYNIHQWRGSPLKYNNIQILPTYHPRILSAQKDLFSVFDFDVKKALRPHKQYNDDITVAKDSITQHNLVDEILSAEYVSIDIETRRNPQLDLLCVGFGLSESRAIVIPVRDNTQIISEIIPKISKPIYHNGIFDVSVLRYFHSIPAKTPYFDTMVAQHVLYPEMPKGLDFLCSTITDRPCYWAGIKFDEENKSWSDKRSLDDLYIYNAKDVLVTYESYLDQSRELESHPSREIFNYEMEMLDVAMHISSTGFRVDTDRKQLLLDVLTKKKNDDLIFLFTILQRQINPASPKQMKELLYDELKLPVRKGRDGKVTTNEDALVSLIGFCNGELKEKKTEEAKQKWRMNVAILKILLNVRKYDKLISSYVGVEISRDGRMRGMYKVTGTESGRWAGGVWLDETGLNPQTLPRESVEV